MMVDQALIEKIVAEVVNEIDKIKTDEQLILVEASARHLHLCQNDFDQLFGKGNSLTTVSELSQPGQFLAQERVSLIGPKTTLNRIAVLGPLRNETQVELSYSDARLLGVKGMLRNSGQLEDTPGLQISANGKTITLDKGVIVAKRHIHVNSRDALKLKVKDNDIVSVAVNSNRPVIFNDVLIRVSDQFETRMHIDFDEANACGFQTGKTWAKLIKDE